MPNVFNPSEWDKDADLLIFDDVEFQFTKRCVITGLWGGQKRIGLDGKFARIKTIEWGRPFIWLCNADNNPFHARDEKGNLVMKDSQRAWFRDNCVEVNIPMNFNLFKTSHTIQDAVRAGINAEDFLDEHDNPENVVFSMEVPDPDYVWGGDPYN